MPASTNQIIFHAACPDGRTAAWLLGRVLPSPVFVPFAHGDELPEPGTGDVWVVDLSFPEPVLRAWAASGRRRVVVLDHHLSAAGLLGAVNSPLERTLGRIADPSWFGLTVSVVMDRSGAGLAAEAVRVLDPRFEVPAFVADIEDRDLWRWSIPGSRQVCAGFDTLTGSVAGPEALDALLTRTRDDLAAVGAPQIAAFDAEVDVLVAAAAELDVAGFRVPMVEVPGRRFGSWVGHRLLELHPHAPFAGYWFTDPVSMRVQVGLRSEDARADVSEVAARFGGGGHRNASGLTCTALGDLAAARPAPAAG